MADEQLNSSLDASILRSNIEEISEAEEAKECTRKNSAKKSTSKASRKIEIRKKKIKGRVIITSSSGSDSSSSDESKSENVQQKQRATLKPNDRELSRDLEFYTTESFDKSYFSKKFNCKPCSVKLTKLNSSQLKKLQQEATTKKVKKEPATEQPKSSRKASKNPSKSLVKSLLR